MQSQPMTIPLIVVIGGVLIATVLVAAFFAPSVSVIGLVATVGVLIALILGVAAGHNFVLHLKRGAKNEVEASIETGQPATSNKS